MGNIVTPEQGLLPLPPYSGVTTPYPWWLNAALAIWALLALLCCWLLLLLYFLRYCCKWWRHRQYAADRKSLRQRLFGSRGAAYATKQQHFATAPLPPVPYAVSDGIYGGAMPYVTGGAIRSFGSEVDPSDGVVENVETNIHRNVTKNYYINEEKNYFIQNDPVVQAPLPAHDLELRTLPAPTVTTINMAAERITDNPNWEKADPKEEINHQAPKQAIAEIVKTDATLSRQEVIAERPPEVFTHRPETPRVQNRILGAKPSTVSDDGSITSEMSGHDSESIYETIRVLTPKKQTLTPLEDEDEYRTAGIDEVEFEVKDLIRLQKATARSGDPYDDILSSANVPRQQLRPHTSSISSSSTLNNLMPSESRQEGPVTMKAGEEETVTQTVQTQQIQTTFRQIGQQLGDSAFFVPLAPAITHHDGQHSGDSKVRVPISNNTTTTTTTVRQDEQPSLEYF